MCRLRLSSGSCVLLQNDGSYIDIRLRVLGGHHLAKKDIFGASDPYVKIDLDTVNGDLTARSVTTKTKKKTLNPRWNEEFLFRVSMMQLAKNLSFSFNRPSHCHHKSKVFVEFVSRIIS